METDSWDQTPGVAILSGTAPAPRGPRAVLDAFARLLASLSDERANFFFGAEQARRLRNGDLPNLTNEQLQRSQTEPVPFCDDVWLYGGHLFVNRFFVRARRGRKRYAAFRKLDPVELIGRQPWVQWDPRLGSFTYRDGGASQQLRQLSQPCALFRGCGETEAAIWVGLRRWVDGGASESSREALRERLAFIELNWNLRDLGAVQELQSHLLTECALGRPERLQLASRLLKEISFEYRAVLTSPSRDAAQRWAFVSGYEDGTILEFGLSMADLDADVASRIYFGIEDGEFEAGFYTAEARLALLESLKEP